LDISILSDPVNEILYLELLGLEEFVEKELSENFVAKKEFIIV
jgi:hypothetical protein